MQRAPNDFFSDYKYLLSSVLTSNQVVGSSNLSGRAISASRAMWSVRLGDHSVGSP